LIGFVFLLVLISATLSAMVPSSFAARINPMRAIKGKNVLNAGKSPFSAIKVLVYFQFLISAILISGGLWAINQVNYMMDKDIGYNKDALLHCRIEANGTNKSYETLRMQILSHPGIVNMGLSYNTPLHNNWGSDIQFEGGDANDWVSVRYNAVCEDYIETFGFRLTEGRGFSKTFLMKTIVSSTKKLLTGLAGTSPLANGCA
jgi:putative ABC transport system permease protein